MIITEIKKSKQLMKYHLYVDDVFFGVFLDEMLAKFNLKTGQEVDEELLYNIKEENDEKLAFLTAVNYLERYNVSTKGLKDYLYRKNFKKNNIESAVEKLKEYGYLDDRNFAKNYFESLSATKGKRVIINKLKEKGISEEIIDELVEDVSDEAEEERAKILAEKFAKNRENTLKNKQKCFAHLIYKGYDYSVAQKIVNELFLGAEDDRF